MRNVGIGIAPFWYGDHRFAMDAVPNWMLEMPRRRKSRRFKLARRLGLLTALVLACLLDWYAVTRKAPADPAHSTASSGPGSNALAQSLRGPEPTFPSAIPSIHHPRVVYPYSVVAGGVQSIEELRLAIEKDPVVAAHYATFQLARARIVSLDQERSMHVSYRLGNQVYWSKRELILRKGESLITDGVHTARARCGNQIAETTMAPVSDLEPPPDEFNAPSVIEIGNGFDPAAVAAPNPGGPPIEPGPPSRGKTPPVHPGPPEPINPPIWIQLPPPPPVVKVAEPGTGLLLLIAFPALWIVRRRMRTSEPGCRD